MDFRGNRGNTQEQPYDNERGRAVSMPSGATSGYKGTKFHWIDMAVGVAHTTAIISKTA